jgi:predicted ATP-grasp superfamily ATP-dependent carboligase
VPIIPDRIDYNLCRTPQSEAGELRPLKDGESRKCGRPSEERTMVIDATTPALVFRAEGYCGLGIVRSLGRLGVRVHGVDDSPWAYGLRSRYCAGRFTFPSEGAPSEALVEFLRGVARKAGGRPILYPTFDSRNVFVEEHGDALAECLRFPRQPKGLVSRLYNKRSMYALCKEIDVPTAETLFPMTIAEVEAFLDRVQFPLVLKAIEGDRLMRHAGIGMVITRSREELLAAYRRLDEPGVPNLMLQEYIPGDDDTIWMFNGYFDRDSECRFGITGRKLRQTPVHTGMTSLGVCLPCPTVEESTKKIAKAVGYRGIIDIGYRFDARDGRYKVLDINPRIGATFRLFVDRNGMDVARAQYLDLTGQPVPATEPDWGRKWIVEDRDVVSSWHYFREGSLGPVRWARSFAGLREGAHFAVDDPVPTVGFAAAFAGRVLGGAWRTAARAVGLMGPTRATGTGR